MTTEGIINKEKIEVPKFLTEPVTLTKPEERHLTKLAEIAEHLDEEDAKVIIDILAAKHPQLMFKSLAEMHNNITNQLYDVKKIIQQEF